MSRFTRGARLSLAAAGIIVGLVGLAVWSFETEYGGNPVAGSESTGDGLERVFDVDETRLDASGQPVTTIVFEGTPEEAREFIQRRHEEGRDYRPAGAVIGLGVIIVIVAALPPWKRSPET